jgi:hypothetical protein
MKVNAKDVPHDAPPPVSSAHINSPAAFNTHTACVCGLAPSRREQDFFTAA